MEDMFINILKDFFNQTKSLNKKVGVLSVSDGIWQLFLTGHTKEWDHCCTATHVIWRAPPKFSQMPVFSWCLGITWKIKLIFIIKGSIPNIIKLLTLAKKWMVLKKTFVSKLYSLCTRTTLQSPFLKKWVNMWNPKSGSWEKINTCRFPYLLLPFP